MAQSKTTIELNGVTYDARTGAVLNGASSTPVVSAPAPRKTGGNVDGFVRRPQASVPAPVVVKPAAPSRTVSQSASAHKTEKSKTLMRHAVSKPAPSPVKASAKPARTKKADTLVSPDTLADERLKRAQQASKSSSISRFGLLGNKNIEPTVTHLPVQPHPEEAAEAIPTPVSQAAQRHAQPQTTASATFGAALANADSHTKPRLKSPSLRHRTANKLGVSSKVVGIVSAAFAFVVLSAVITYENAPNISMHLASTRAGFKAALPDYIPSGFSLNNQIAAAPGQVTVNFKSNSDKRAFQVTQQPSNWTSSSLLANYVQPKGSDYQIVQDKGRTLYIVDGTTTWVNGGVWYQVKGDADLSNEQLTHIADSL